MPPIEPIVDPIDEKGEGCRVISATTTDKSRLLGVHYIDDVIPGRGIDEEND